MPDRTPVVAWLGTGTIGLPMAQQVVRAGLPTRAWNRTRSKAEPLADDGATVAGSAVEAARDADLLVTVLLDADAVAEAASADVLAALAPGAVWAQMSTVGVEGTERLAAQAADAGVTFVDAPVLGTKEPAEQGALTVLASGPDDALDRCAPVFEAVGKKTLRVGDVGAGSRLKLVANSWILVVDDGTAQVLRLAQGLGVDPQHFFDAIADGPLDAPYVHVKGRLMLEDRFPTSFSVSGAAKDAGLMIDAGTAAGVDVALLEVARDHLRRAVDAGYGDDDMAAIVKGHGGTDG